MAVRTKIIFIKHLAQEAYLNWWIVLALSVISIDTKNTGLLNFMPMNPSRPLLGHIKDELWNSEAFFLTL